MPAGTYTTKFQAGGSGDNYIPDGFIKSVEKVWMDSYTLTSNMTGTNSTIDIAVIPNNKKIVSIDVEIETSISQTNGTISIGFSTDAAVDAFFNPATITHNATRTSIALPGPGLLMNPTSTSSTITPGKLAGFQLVTAGTQTTISVKLNNWTMTTGTLKTVVRYT